MEFSYETQKLRAICLSPHLAESEYDANLAEKLYSRLADISIMKDASEIFDLPGQPRVETNNNELEIIINLTTDCVLRLQSGHPKSRRQVDEPIKWNRVRRIKILGLEKMN